MEHPDALEEVMGMVSHSIEQLLKLLLQLIG